MKFTLASLFAALCSSFAAHASSPGQPLDCSDWEIELPGIACGIEIALPCSGPGGTLDACSLGMPVQTSADGDLLYIRTVYLGVNYCDDPGGVGIGLNRYELTRLRNGMEARIAYLEERCGRTYANRLQPRGLTFDAAHGKLRLAVRNLWGMSGGGEDVGSQLMAFTGFTTTFEILQTYTPTASLGFRVPYMPEGLPAADHFDTYYGSLVKPIEFSKAQGLQCDYPANPPAVGDYLEVADTVPTPAPGQGVYYVTAVTHQAQVRYGRKASGGMLSGREAGRLAECAMEDRRAEE